MGCGSLAPVNVFHDPKSKPGIACHVSKGAMDKSVFDSGYTFLTLSIIKLGNHGPEWQISHLHWSLMVISVFDGTNSSQHVETC